VPAILRLIRELADYERSLHEVTATEQDLRSALFGAVPMDEWTVHRLTGRALRDLGAVAVDHDDRSMPR
jgi:hypothetical protein